MSRFASPLRYPGGKTSTLAQTREIIIHNKLERGYYVEPYAGGCGLALSLLFEGSVDHIYINDIDRSIWAFWHSILNETENFIKKIEKTNVNIIEWHKQKRIQDRKVNNVILTLGFSTFFLNRTNRSGIIKAGPIGGMDQSGTYKLDCRFNKKNLIKRIEKIAKYKSKISLYNLDALEFMQKLTPEIINKKGILNIDPPYFDQGPYLYTNAYKKSDHSTLADAILSYPHPWMLTYDNSEYIKSLYTELPRYNFSLNYAAGAAKKGTELLVLSKGLSIPKKLLDQKLIIEI